MTELPESNSVDIATLSTIFKPRYITNSYKFLFFRALLLLFKKKSFKQNVFSFKELEKEMLNIAEYSINVYKLNFGSQDQIAEILKSNKEIEILKYVPYRLLTPFFSNELRGKKDYVKNDIIQKLSNVETKNNPIYKIAKSDIELYPEWTRYFQKHFAIVESWTSWHWIEYLQKRNPNALSLVNKLQKPQKRISLSQQTIYWKSILDHKELNCIFSEQPLTENDLSLDHFLPWSFIGHDQLWNLIPVSKSINSAKSDNIPHKDYLDSFINMQISGLEISKKYMKEEWEKSVDDFVMGLNINFSDLRDEVKIRKRYKETMKPLFDIASNTGFSTD